MQTPRPDVLHPLIHLAGNPGDLFHGRLFEDQTHGFRGEKEREGYVPNVVYSCGAIIHNDELVIPYAMSDINSGVATVIVSELLNCMRAVA